MASTDPGSGPVTGAARGPVSGVRPDTEDETYNPWTVVNLVFTHLASEGLHPVLGSTGDPGAPAAALLRALGIEPAAEGNRQVTRDIRAHLADIRAAVLGDVTPVTSTVSD